MLHVIGSVWAAYGQSMGRIIFYSEQSMQRQGMGRKSSSRCRGEKRAGGGNVMNASPVGVSSARESTLVFFLWAESCVLLLVGSAVRFAVESVWLRQNS